MNYYNTVEKSLEDHPEFRTPRNDWRVRASYTNPETGEYVPENRNDWRADEDGKSLSDWWDFEKKVMRDDSPLPGVSTYLAYERT